jgi:ribosomal protein L40E
MSADGEKGKLTMHLRHRVSKLFAVALAGATLVALLLVAGPVYAADAPASQFSVSDILSQLDQLQNMTVEEDVCAKCHANYDPAASFANDIKFSHGYHLKMQCSDCHTQFPHQKSGTQRPTMKICMNCHGLYHGPQGIIAKANCEACHNTPKWQLSCPYNKTNDWAAKGHVAKGTTDTNKDCMMCHQQSDCVTCHDQKNILWAPSSGWGYDPGVSNGPKDGCYACHGNATLLAPVGGTNKSFQVTGVSDSVHYKNTCQECHPDFNYTGAPGATKLWNVNAGIQCGTCHQNQKEKKLSDPVRLYELSIHAQKIRSGNLNSATCSSCHGGHFIYSLDTIEGKATMHANEGRVCAVCHNAQYVSYDDYYHGQPYKDGATDAPSCWQCHGSHDVRPKVDAQSAIYDKNLGKTCGQPGCHKGSTEQFGAQAGQLIHRKVEAAQGNPLVQLISKVKGAIGLR